MYGAASPFSRSICRSVLLIGALCCGARANEPVPTFHETIRALQKARSAIRSYDVVINVEGGLKDATLPMTDSSGKTFVPNRYLVAYTLEMARDTERDHLLVARQEVHEDAKSKERTTDTWEVYGRDPEWVLHGRGGLVARKRQQNSYKPSYFDPFALGLGFMAEFQNGESWENVTTNYLNRSDNTGGEWVREGVLRFSSPRHHIEIDVQRGYWPVSMAWRGSRDELIVQADIVVEELHGQWLPKSGRIENEEREYSLTFDWRSVNQPLGERFDVRQIATRYRLELPQQN